MSGPQSEKSVERLAALHLAFREMEDNTSTTEGAVGDGGRESSIKLTNKCDFVKCIELHSIYV